MLCEVRLLIATQSVFKFKLNQITDNRWHFQTHFLFENSRIFSKISLKCVSKSLFNGTLMQAWVMDWSHLEPISQRVYELIIQNLMKSTCSSYAKNNDPIKSQFCTCHDSQDVMTCAKLWLDWMMIIKMKAIWFFTRFQLWAHKPFVQWSPGNELSSMLK